MFTRYFSFFFILTALVMGQSPTTTLTATAGNGEVALRWTPPAGMASAVFRVYRGTAAGVSLTGPIATLTGQLAYTDREVANDATYFYRVVGSRPFGVPTHSNEVSARPAGAAMAPPAPQSFVAQAGTNRVTLGWSAVPGATSYSLFRGTVSNGQGNVAFVSGLTSLSYVDQQVAGGTTYYYRLAAQNAVGLGTMSVEVAAAPNAPAQPPGAVTNLSAVAGNALVTLNWGALAGATSYNIFRSTSAGAPNLTPVATDVRVVTFTDRSVENGRTYHYRVVAVNASGAGPSSNLATATPTAPVQPPAAPTGLTLVSGDKQITLSWTAPVGTLVTTYSVFRSTTPNITGGVPIVSGLTANTFVNTGLQNGVPYYYRVAATNSAGMGALSAEAFASPNAPVTQAAMLLFAQLGPEGAAQTGASGSATLQLSGDGNTAVLRYSFTNLTSPITGKHLHGPASPGENGAIAFDIDTAVPQMDGSFIWTIRDIASATRQQILDALNSGRVYLNIHTVRFPQGEIRGHFRAVNSQTSFTPPPAPPALPPGPPTANDAARFLTQAAWGVTTADIAQLRQTGFDAWITTQRNLPQRSHTDYVRTYLAANPTTTTRNQVMETFWTQALTGEDQLRSRVALALSEIFVVSDRDPDLSSNPRSMASWLDLLNRNAFGNVRTLLEEVTLHPAMGRYLDMLRNEKENSAGRVPNENYAREILQLFSIGLWKLHPDGSLAFDQNLQPISTYDQNAVLQFSRIFTGWSWGGNPKTDTQWRNATVRDGTIPMEAWPQFHSTGPKALLDGFVVPAGQTPEVDLRQALDNIFQHPNIGPFLCRQLIQRLVTSNPSPGYVYRVAQVFNNNGGGVRGDLGAVVRAILLDYEARSTSLLSNQGFGKQKEPMVRYGQLLRTFKPTSANGTFSINNLEGSNSMGQNPLRPLTVFNFFLPHFVQPGPLAQAGLVAPEFQITTESQVIAAMNTLSGIIYSGGLNGTATRISLNFSEQTAIAGNLNALLDQLNLLMLSGQMSAGLRSAITDSMSTLADPSARVRRAVHLIITSPEWVIQK